LNWHRCTLCNMVVYWNNKPRQIPCEFYCLGLFLCNQLSTFDYWKTHLSIFVENFYEGNRLEIRENNKAMAWSPFFFSWFLRSAAKNAYEGDGRRKEEFLEKYKNAVVPRVVFLKSIESTSSKQYLPVLCILIIPCPYSHYFCSDCSWHCLYCGFNWSALPDLEFSLCKPVCNSLMDIEYLLFNLVKSFYFRTV
jgi:hypothetical protein